MVKAAWRTVSSLSLARDTIRASNSGVGVPTRLLLKLRALPRRLPSRPPLKLRAAAWRVARSSDFNCSCSFTSSSGLNSVSGGGGGGGASALSRSAPSSNCQRKVTTDRRLRFSVAARVLHSNSTRLGKPSARSNSIRPSPVALIRGSEPVNMRVSRLIVFCHVTVAGVASVTLIFVFCRAASTPCAERPGKYPP